MNPTYNPPLWQIWRNPIVRRYATAPTAQAAHPRQNSRLITCNHVTSICRSAPRSSQRPTQTRTANTTNSNPCRPGMIQTPGASAPRGIIT